MIERELLQSLLNGTISLGLILVGLWLIIKWILPKLMKSQQDHIDTLIKAWDGEHDFTKQLLAASREDQREFATDLKESATALRAILTELVQGQGLHEERSKNRYEAVEKMLEPRR